MAMKGIDKSRVPWAFTLIELLVVISIIALLIGILLPALGAARKVAQSAQCKSNLRQHGIGLHTYSVDFKGRLPWGEWAVGVPGNEATDWSLLALWAMGKTESTWMAAAVAGSHDTGVSKLSFCPSSIPQDTSTGIRLRSYASHPRVMPQLVSIFTPSGSPGPIASAGADRYAFTYKGATGAQRYLQNANVYEIKNASGLFIAADTNQGADFGNTWPHLQGFRNLYGNMFAATGEPWFVANVPGFDYSTFVVHAGPNTDPANSNDLGHIRFRHTDSANLLFLDGHVADRGWSSDTEHDIEIEDIMVKY